jgi:hypothetical protein
MGNIPADMEQEENTAMTGQKSEENQQKRR